MDILYIAAQDTSPESICRNHTEINLNSTYFIVMILKLKNIPKKNNKIK